jgi:glucosamine--fructose-6-phosphate aminotransferase (isomerizing)
MCSVVGCIANDKIREVVLEGLLRLEYRGYDSVGYAAVDKESATLSLVRAEGVLDNIRPFLAQLNLDEVAAIGHTRWATHGKVSVRNAHPHISCDEKLAVVHNGIIENYRQLKSDLESKGHFFRSETDSEVIIHQFEEFLLQGMTFQDALHQLANVLEGSYAFIIISVQEPNKLFFMRKNSPLCVGFSDNRSFIASDVLAFSDWVREVFYIPDKSYGILTQQDVQLFDFKKQLVFAPAELVHTKWAVSEKGEYEHYMLKEIYEQKDAIIRTISHYQWYEDCLHELLGLNKATLQSVEKIILVGCGTSWHAARIAEFFFESIAKIPSIAVLASEFRYKTFFPSSKTLYVFVSQSGETADTLEVLRMVSQYDLLTVALSNVATSTMVRECKGRLLTHAGPEIAVASTKAFSTQISALYWLALTFSLNRGHIAKETYDVRQQELLQVAHILEESIDKYKEEIVYSDVEKYKNVKHAIFIGRHVSYTFALEAALKLKEISYIFSQAYPAGELKHGPLALIDTETPVFVFSHPDPVLYQKTVSNAQEVKARNGVVIAFACEGQTELINLADRVFIIPMVHPLLFPLAITGLMQYFCYSLARACDRPIDKPRNLAKSVTVE